MREYLIKNGGLEVVGIFRLAPDADESTFVKQQLVSGRGMSRSALPVPALCASGACRFCALARPFADLTLCFLCRAQNENKFVKCDDVNCISNLLKGSLMTPILPRPC
jgi:hypothetical protein